MLSENQGITLPDSIKKSIMVNGFKNTIKVLHLDNLIRDGELISNCLKQLPCDLHYHRIETLRELEESLYLEWDLILSEYHLNFLNIYEALNIIKARSKDVPLIVVSNSIGEENVVDLLKAGANDFVCKERLERLIPAIERTLKEVELKVKVNKSKLAANKALAAKEQMLAVVSHDIKNPLSAIQLEAQMLLRISERAGEMVSSEVVKNQMKRVLKTTDRLKNLISDLLDRNKKEEGLSSLSKIQVDPNKLISDVLDAYKGQIDGKEITLCISTEKMNDFLLDSNKIFQVFSNLLGNAIKFTPRRGRIEISLHERVGDLTFTILDSGPGLNYNEQNKVFEKYWSGHNSVSGTGLGLFICKTIIEAHGGHISVENVPSRGALFKVSIPRIVSAHSLPIMQSKYDSRKQVLIVDDDDDLRDVISWALGREGYQVWSYHNPHEAMDCLNEGLIPHLMVVDFHMDGMKGSEFLSMKQLSSRSEVSSCPVVMISACPDEVMGQVPRELYREVLAKPLDLEGLVQQIKLYS